MSERTHYQHQQAINTSNNEESRHNQKNEKENNIPYNITSSVAKTQRTFGERMCPLEEGIVRVASINVNCLGVFSKSNAKQDLLKEWIHENEISILGIQEMGIAMHMVPSYDKMNERMRDLRWTKHRVISANNIHESITKAQYGGTAVCTFNEVAVRCSPKNGCDPSGLGRWSWLMFEGRNKHRTRVISAYNPCKSKGQETVYMQHSRYFHNNGISECPRKLFIKDLTAQINGWQSQGDHIVLLIDCNENLVRRGPLHMSLLQKCRLIDPIRLAYQNEDTTLPPTSSSGSYPIDSIFVSQQLRNIDRGGWLCQGTSIGDHRPLYIDLPISVLLGEPSFTLYKPEARRLQCDRPKIVRRYNELLKHQLSYERTPDKFNELERRIHGNTLSKQEIQSSLEKIDNSCTNSMLYAERRCRKLHMGNVPWTPELSKAGKTIMLWNLVIRKKCGRNVSSTYVKRLAKKCDINHPMSLSMSDCEEERKSAMQTYKHLKKKAPAKRKQFIVQLAEDQAKAGNESISTAIRRIVRVEEERQSRRRIKASTKPYFGATEKIRIPDPNKENLEIVTTDKETIEKALGEENMEKFQLAYSSPFLQHPYKLLLGQTATTETAKRILNGTFRSPITTKSHKRFLRCLQMPACIKKQGPNDTLCTTEEAALYWKRKREKTSSSMSNRHIGTYKALTNDIASLRIINGVTSMAYEMGVTLPRWENDLDVTLIKKPGKIRPSEFRTIGTLEADFNQGAALHFSKRMMSTAMSNSLIPSSQYATKGNRAIEAATVKVLYFDYLRINKRQGAFLAMDLMQCFDRMAHPVSSLATQRLGVHPNVVDTMIQTLCNMRHYIRTAYGDSEDYYTGAKDRPLQGGVQGNGAAAPIFLAISCVILNYFEGLITGHKVRSAVSLTILSILAVMYVDDTDILISATSYDEPLESIVARAKNASKHWRRAVAQTGGALRPEKCRWYLISFIWKSGRWKYGKIKDMPYSITERDDKGRRVTVERLEINVGHKGLGVHSAPDGSFEQQMQALLEKINTWNSRIHKSYLRKYDVYLSAFSSLFKSIEYVLPATSLTTTQCTTLNKAIHKKFISRIGINKHLPLSYRYAPKKYQGLGSLNVETQQLIEKLKIFMFHCHQSTVLGQSIMTILESMQLLLCMDQPIFLLSYEKYGFLCAKEHTWISHLWQTCEKHCIVLKVQYPCPNLARVNDFVLMQHAIESQKLTKEELLSLQRCLIYLQVLHASDISNGQGTTIRSSFFRHEKSSHIISMYQWPFQPKPPPSDWKIWNRALIEIWTQNEQGIFQTPLGPWISKSHLQSKWKYHKKEQIICDTSLSPHRFFTYHQTSTRSCNAYVPLSSIPSRLSTPYNAFISNTSTNAPILDGYIPDFPIIDNDTPILRKFFQHSIFSHQAEIIATSIINGNAVAVSDSSIMPTTNTGSASWVLAPFDSNDGICFGDHGVPHGSVPLDSYRGELYGIYAILKATCVICDKYEIVKGKIIVACDNDSSLFNALSKKNRAKVTQSNFDILWAIHALKKKLSIDIIPQKVKGHCDRLRRPLTRLEQLNVYVDKRASIFRQYMESTTSYAPLDIHTKDQCQIFINGHQVTANIPASIKNWIHGNSMQQFLDEKGYLAATAFNLVNWNAIEKAHKLLSHSRHLWAVKFVSGFCGVATKMKSWGYWDSPICPLCQQSNENTSHMICCPDVRSRARYKQCSKKLFKWLRNNDTHPEFLQLLTLVIQPGTPQSFVQHLHSQHEGSSLQTAAHLQDKIGYHNLFCGRIATKWMEVQSQYFHSIGSKRSPMNWSMRFILQLLQFSHSMWKHRCNIVHDGDMNMQTEKEIKKLNAEIKDEFITGKLGIRTCHNSLFDKKLKKVLKMSVKEKKFWLLTVRASRQYVIQQNSNMYDGMRDVMNTWCLQPD